MMDSINKILIGMEQSVGPTKGQEVLFLADGSFALRGIAILCRSNIWLSDLNLIVCVRTCQRFSVYSLPLFLKEKG